ncbi:hypothetical protein [Polaribacter porphyrae]|uniref:Uncharacterized protein n=1 Tax=Polaribacter porphyrae TaxID=1137780 RepID=A0A2S7WJI1_9FLAO|nr:hypothetical protein [Polaribacter porphyrae]PQJ77765.1 hypothetical protein BTO18_00550 [Polaribacter porphyrae]
MSKKLPLKKVVYFLCSPSLGMLDNWLPVIWSLKEKRKDLKFVIIFPKSNAINQIHLSNVLIILAAKIFDSIIFKSHGKHWLTTNTFSEAKIINKPSKLEWFLLRVSRKLKKWPITKTLGSLIHYGYNKFSKLLNKKYLCNWQFTEKNEAYLLFDIYEESKSYNLELMKNFAEVPKFSIQHGININDGGILRKTKNKLNNDFRKDVNAYLFSSKERPFYEYEYAIHKSKMEVVGVPRHSPNWMEFIRLNILKQSNKINEKNKGSIFIISRPGTTKYFPYERKKKALENIKLLAWKDLKKNIVVKLHPKERKEGIYEEVFGNENYGDNWIYSDLHPFVLGKECDFAISFYSGVVIDMLALGVPTIEYLDLRGISEFDNNKSLRDKNDEPVFSYRYLDLVLGASDYFQMKEHVMEIMNNRETVLSKLQTKYNELFPQIKNINNWIAQDILDASPKKFT